MPIKEAVSKELEKPLCGQPSCADGKTEAGEGETLPQGHAGRLMLGCVPVPAVPAFGAPRVPVSCPQGLCHSHLVG